MERCSISGIDLSTPYVVVDMLTGEVVYRTTYRHRNRARRWADRKDLQYGACRYSARFLPGQDLGPVRLNAYGDIGGAK